MQGSIKGRTNMKEQLPDSSGIYINVKKDLLDLLFLKFFFAIEQIRKISKCTKYRQQ